MTPQRPQRDHSDPPTALVTGAARRVGAAIAAHLHESGYRVAVQYRTSAAEAQRLVEGLNGRRANSALALSADLADDRSSRQLIERAEGWHGGLDLLVNNASDFYPTAVGTITSDDWDQLFASNARGPLFLSQAAAAPLRLARGSIVNVADIHAERPLRHHTVYCMAKAALVMMTRSLALELAPEIRVNAVAPGAILWPEREISDDDRRLTLGRVPLARLGNPRDIARAVAYLAGEPYVTGQVLAVDGGRSLNM